MGPDVERHTLPLAEVAARILIVDDEPPVLQAVRGSSSKWATRPAKPTTGHRPLRRWNRNPSTWWSRICACPTRTDSR